METQDYREKLPLTGERDYLHPHVRFLLVPLNPVKVYNMIIWSRASRNEWPNGGNFIVQTIPRV